MEYTWTPAQVDTIAKSLFNKMQNKEESNTMHVSNREQDRFDLEIKDEDPNNGTSSHSTRYGTDKYFLLTYYGHKNQMSLTVGKTQGKYSISWLPWKDKEIKRLIKHMKYTISHATELRATQSIHRIFPDAVTREFEKTVLK